MGLTPKQETFCQKYIELGNASEAYRQSYDSNGKMETINRAAKELLDNPKIAARVKEIQAIHLKRHEVTVDSITEELDEARRLALTIEQPASAITASMGKAKLHGLLVEKAEINASVETKDTSMTESARRIAFLLRSALEEKKG